MKVASRTRSKAAATCASRAEHGWRATLDKNVELQEFIGWFAERNDAVLLYGGAVRDFILRGPDTVIRDLDFAIENESAEKVAAAFEHSLVGRNRFGGYRFSLGGTSVDCWSLPDTWAFKEKQLALQDWEDLTKASLLNIDGIVLRITRHAQELSCDPFLEATHEAKIEMCLPQTFDWTAALFRTLALAARYDFHVSAKLLDVIASRGPLDSVRFVDFADRRFGEKESPRFFDRITQVLKQDVAADRRPARSPLRELLSDLSLTNRRST